MYEENEQNSQFKETFGYRSPNSKMDDLRITICEVNKGRKTKNQENHEINDIQEQEEA